MSAVQEKNTVSVPEAFTARFSELETAWSQNGSSWFLEKRRDAMSRFSSLGLPTRRDEEWKYTNVQPLKNVAFESRDGSGVSADDLRASGIEGLDAISLVFVDGHYRADLSSLANETLPEGVVVESFASAISSRRGELESFLSSEAPYDDRSFVALNTALAQDGAFISVAKNTVVEKPILLRFVASKGSAPSMAHARVLIVAETSSDVQIIEDYASVDAEGVHLDNVVTEVFVAENARVRHQKLERSSEKAYHIASIAVRQAANSRFVSNSFSFGGALVRNDISANLDGEGIESTLNGLVVGGGSQHIDNHTRIVHAKPNCNSWEVYKAVLDGKAHGVFNGKIYVAEDAQKTDAKQTNQSLLLADTAVMDAKPELEIYADDVKCTHGATIGQIDEEGVFYLRSRGIDHESARDLLTYAFASDIVEHVDIEPLKAVIEGMLFDKLPKSRLLEESR